MKTKGTFEEATSNPLKVLKMLFIALHFGYYPRIEFQWKRQQEEPIKFKNPLLENEENWQPFTELEMSWEEVVTRNNFFNETEKRLTLSKDTSYDPQLYSFYKPIDGVPFWIQKELPKFQFVFHCNKNRKNVPWWVRGFSIVTYPLRFIPKKDIRKMSKHTCYSFRIGSLKNGISLEFYIPKKFSLK